MKFIKNHLSNKLILVSLILLQIIVIGKTNETNNKVSDEKFTEIIKDVKENFKKLKSIVTEKGGKVEGLKLGFINKNNRFLKTKNDVKVS